MIIIWYTQPINSFASFYYFDSNTRVLIRIRLELGRKDGGETKAIYRTNRYYTFSPDGSLLKRTNLSVRAGKVVASNGAPLTDNPIQAYYVYDFSSSNGLTPDSTPHHGNMVTSNPNLPAGIDQATLVKLAQMSIQKGADIFLTKSNASDTELIQAIKNAIV